MPTLGAFFDVFMTSFIKLYRSIRKLRVGPLDRRTIRKDGAIGVNVKASK